jgi:fructose-bisphosphate aldolase class II
MPIVHLRDLVAHAYRNGYALGAFEVQDLESLSGVLQAAEECRAPAILSIPASGAAGAHSGALLAAVEHAAASAQVPLGVQATGIQTQDGATAAVNRGCNGLSVAVRDGALDRRISQARRIVELAHGCSVPAEVRVGGAGSAGDQGHPSIDEVRAFAERTGADFVHIEVDAREGRSAGRAKPDYRRVARTAEAVERPLAVDADERLGEDQMRRLIGCGVAKVNCASVFGGRASASAFRPERGSDASRPHGGIRAAVGEQVARCMRVWGAAGRAAEVQMQCRGWATVDHTIVLQAEDSASAEEAARILQAGRKALSEVPGVREVLVGQAAIRTQPPVRFWLVRVVHPSIIDRLNAWGVEWASPEGCRSADAAEPCSGVYRGTGPFPAVERDAAPRAWERPA